MDNKSKIGSTDNTRININENYEVENWSEKFGVSADKLKEAVNAVGTSAKEVEKYLNK